MKKCSSCQEVKSIDLFYAHPKGAQGRLNRCKECHKAATRENRLKRIDYYREYDRERGKRPERLANAIAQTRKWRNEDKRRSVCHVRVARALRSGELEPKPCEWPGCGSDNVMAHHESYDRPLDVVFYCQSHHKARHKQMAIEGIEP